MRGAAATALALLALAAPAWAAHPRTSLNDIEDEVMCTICGTALGLSESPQANRERVFIRRLIARGYTKQRIKDELVKQYGPQVLATPSTKGFDLAAWIIPGLAIALAAGALVVGVRRWRGAGGPPGAAPPPSGDTKRLDEDMARYDL